MCHAGCAAAFGSRQPDICTSCVKAHVESDRWSADLDLAIVLHPHEHVVRSVMFVLMKNHLINDDKNCRVAK